MNLDAHTMKLLGHLLLILHDNYEGREVTVVDSGVRVSAWLAERPEIYVNIDKEYNQPITGPDNCEVQSIIVELLEKTSKTSTHS